MNKKSPITWNSIIMVPPNEILEVIDSKGVIANAVPTYYPFEIIIKNNDRNKQWGWRGTPVFRENNEEKWDGGWYIFNNLNSNKIDEVVGWRKIENKKICV